MSTQRAPFWHNFWPWRNDQPSSTNWQCSPEQAQRYPQRERATDEVPQPRAQNTDGIRYPLHQHEQPERPFLAWRDEQPVLRPRMVNETGPKSREMLGHIQKIEPQIARWQPSFMGSRRADMISEKIPCVNAPTTPIPDAPPDQTRDFNPGDLPDFVRAAIPELPVQRVVPDAPIVRKLNPTGNLLATMRPRSRRYELEKTPVDELPTVPDNAGLVRAYLDALPPWHPLPPPSAPPSGWLNDNVADVQIWSEPDVVAAPETDANIPTQKLERKPQAKVNKDATASREFPALWRWELMLKQKESEK